MDPNNTQHNMQHDDWFERAEALLNEMRQKNLEFLKETSALEESIRAKIKDVDKNLDEIEGDLDVVEEVLADSPAQVTSA